MIEEKRVCRKKNEETGPSFNDLIQRKEDDDE